MILKEREKIVELVGRGKNGLREIANWIINLTC